MVYDPLGRLFQVSSPTAGTRRFLYDGDALVAEYDGANALAKRHVHWPGADLPMVTYEGAGLATIRQLLADHQGSIVALADASGAAVQINRYDEYGIPGAGNDGTFQYTGQMWLPELGMYHYKARIYSPTLGRFLQTDPIGYQDQFNLYAYVGNDPVNASDPTGLCSTTDLDGAPVSTEIGICGDTAAEAAAITQLLADENSVISNTETIAVGANQRVDFHLGSQTPTSPTYDVTGGRTISATNAATGERYIGVTIDLNDQVEVPGTNVETGVSTTAVETLGDIAEHEIGRHASDVLLGTGAATKAEREAGAARTENGRRERMHNPFRRLENHQGTLLNP